MFRWWRTARRQGFGACVYPRGAATAADQNGHRRHVGRVGNYEDLSGVVLCRGPHVPDTPKHMQKHMACGPALTGTATRAGVKSFATSPEQ